jgi:hypothetical protein
MTSRATDSAPKPKKKRNLKPRAAGAQLATIPQASDVKGVPVRSIHDLIDRGLLPYVRFHGGRRVWIDLRDFDSLIAASKEVRS